MMKKTYKRILAATLASILVWNTCEWQPRALAGSRIYLIEEVKELPEEILYQEVPYGTKYKALELPDKLSMRVWTEDAEDKDSEEKMATPSQILEAGGTSQSVSLAEGNETVQEGISSQGNEKVQKASPSEMDDTAQKASPSDADGTKNDKNWKEVKVRWVLDETFSEKEKYDGKTPGGLCV